MLFLHVFSYRFHISLCEENICDILIQYHIYSLAYILQNYKMYSMLYPGHRTQDAEPEVYPQLPHEELD